MKVAMAFVLNVAVEPSRKKNNFNNMNALKL